MIDLIAKLISGDGLTTVLIIAVLYVGSLWFLFSFWVYIDAKKRYKRTYIAIMYFFIVLILSFPALVFYLITRPEDESEYLFMHSDNSSNRGVNVPIVNFVGKDGKVNFSLELKINNQDLAALNSDMTVDVNWKSENPEFKKEEPVIEVAVEKSEEPKVALNTFKSNAYSSFKNVRSKVSGFKPKFNLPKKEKEVKKA